MGNVGEGEERRKTETRAVGSLPLKLRVKNCPQGEVNMGQLGVLETMLYIPWKMQALFVKKI